MFHRICLFVLGLTVLTACGCRACYAPYDNCQPTFVPERGDCCMNERYRSGSVFVNKNTMTNEGTECKTCSGDSTSNTNYYSREEVAHNAGNSEVPSVPAGKNAVNTPIWEYPENNESAATEFPGNQSFFNSATNEFPLQENNEDLPSNVVKQKTN